MVSLDDPQCITCIIKRVPLDQTKVLSNAEPFFLQWPTRWLQGAHKRHEANCTLPLNHTNLLLIATIVLKVAAICCWCRNAIFILMWFCYCFFISNCIFCICWFYIVGHFRLYFDKEKSGVGFFYIQKSPLNIPIAVNISICTHFMSSSACHC